jgi:hypothetical protein
MNLFDYDFKESTDAGIDDELLLETPVVTPSEMADWIKSYYPDRSPLAVRSELGSEHIRHRLLLCNNEICQRFDKETIRSHFLDERYFETAHSAVQA